MPHVNLEEVVNLLQIQAELRLAARAASAANFLRTLIPAPSLERKMVNELQISGSNLKGHAVDLPPSGCTLDYNYKFKYIFICRLFNRLILC